MRLSRIELSEDGPAEMVNRFARFYMRELERDRLPRRLPAIVLSRTEKSVEPLNQTRQELAQIYASALS